VARVLYAQVHGREARAHGGGGRSWDGTTTKPALLEQNLALAVAGLTIEHFSGSGAACTLMHAMFIAGASGDPNPNPKGFRIGLGQPRWAMRHDRGPGRPFPGGDRSGHRIVNLAIVNGVDHEGTIGFGA
jgi:hypothetical protein